MIFECEVLVKRKKRESKKEKKLVRTTDKGNPSKF